ncbi:hypothetical protein OAN61_00825 [bacterium]|nr:hypothetical protein [bacterium]
MQRTVTFKFSKDGKSLTRRVLVVVGMRAPQLSCQWLLRAQAASAAVR